MMLAARNMVVILHARRVWDQEEEAMIRRTWVRSMTLGSMLAFLTTANTSYGSGYFVPEMDAEAMAQGSAWTARARGASAIFFNPAGLTQLEGFQISAGVTAIDWTSEFEGPAPLGFVTETENDLVPPSHAYLGYKLGESLALGVGMHNSMGLIMKWPQSWPEGRHFGAFIIEEVDLKTFNINPTIAYAVNENFSLGVGLQWVLASATLENESSLAGLPIPVPLPPLQTTIDADNGGGDFGFNVGLLFKNEKWGFGVQYRSGLTMGLEGEADFTTPTTGIPAIDATLAGIFRDQEGSTEIPIPDLVLAGVAFRPSETVELEFDVNWAAWSDFDEFTINFANATPPDITSEQRWDDGFTYRLGGSFDVSETVELRLGGIYDPTVIPDETLRPLLPEGDRFAGCAGVGFQFGKVDLDLAYMFLKIDERTTTVQEENFNGTYNGQAHLFGATFSFGS